MKRTAIILLAAALTTHTVATADDTLQPGLVGRYYQMPGSLEDFPTITAGQKPDIERVDKQINFASTLEAFPGTKLVDNFYVSWTGLIRIPKDGTYTLQIKSDDGSRLFIDGKLAVDHGGTHEMTEMSGPSELKAGDHEIKIEFFDSEEEAGCVLSWKTDDKAMEVVPAAVFFHKADSDVPGLLAEYYQTADGTEDFPDFPADKKPDLERVDANINFASTQEDWPGTKFKDFFYVRWTGKIRIPANGKYTFFIESDDGSRLFIDGKQVVDNGGAHAMEETSGSVQLTAGDHALKAEFFEKDVDAGCKLSWKSEKSEKQIVPTEVLFH
ncbi:MAG: PA14 domain-containing protein [Verrucomicrobiota bacterium]